MLADQLGDILGGCDTSILQVGHTNGTYNGLTDRLLNALCAI